jgi:hypothetical protein
MRQFRDIQAKTTIRKTRRALHEAHCGARGLWLLQFHVRCGLNPVSAAAVLREFFSIPRT